MNSRQSTEIYFTERGLHSCEAAENEQGNKQTPVFTDQEGRDLYDFPQ